MYVLELSFGDAPERLAARPAHRERLQNLADAGIVRMAGPFTDGSGALLIFDVSDETELQKLVDADPYFSTPGVTITRTQQWDPFIS
jgi:uncharacterized protein